MSTLYKLDLNMTSNNTPSPYVASASSEYSKTRAAYKCFNGIIDGGSSYHSNHCSEGYVQIYLGKPYIITKSIINMRRLTSDYKQKSLTIYGSNDGIQFNNLGSIDISVWNNSDPDSDHTVTFNKNENAYKYYKFNFITDSNSWITINEISLYYIKNNLIKTSNKYIGGGGNLV